MQKFALGKKPLRLLPAACTDWISGACSRAPRPGPRRPALSLPHAHPKM